MLQSNSDLVVNRALLNPLLTELRQLTSPLSKNEIAHLLAKLSQRSLSAPGVLATEVSSWVRFDPALYGREYIIRTEQADLLVLSWLPGQLTPVHNHRGSGCGVYVVSGSGSELVFQRGHDERLYPLSLTHYAPEDYFASEDEDLHQMGNLSVSGEQLVTLHLYSPALTGMEYFSPAETIFAEGEDVYARAVERVKGKGALLKSTGTPEKLTQAETVIKKF